MHLRGYRGEVVPATHNNNHHHSSSSIIIVIIIIISSSLWDDNGKGRMNWCR